MGPECHQPITWFQTQLWRRRLWTSYRIVPTMRLHNSHRPGLPTRLPRAVNALSVRLLVCSPWM
jgi:hypothetical protein